MSCSHNHFMHRSPNRGNCTHSNSLHRFLAESLTHGFDKNLQLKTGIHTHQRLMPSTVPPRLFQSCCMSCPLQIHFLLPAPHSEAPAGWWQRSEHGQSWQRQ